MITITDLEEIKEFTKILNDINQELKSVYGMSSWINRNGNFICCISGQLPSLVEMTYNTNGFTKKRQPIADLVIENYIKPFSYMIYPNEYFSFYKDNKNDICEIIIDEEKNIITFKTLITSLQFLFDKKRIKKEKIERGDLITEISAPKDFPEKALQYENSVFRIVLALDSEEILIDPDIIEDESFLSVKLNKKFIPGIRNKYKKLKAGLVPDDVSIVKVSLYETDEDTKFILKIKCENKNTVVSSYYGITDF